MSEFDPNQHEEIARRLREDGPAQAPADLAGEVMKQVRSEPRRSTSAVRRPLVTLVAASLIVVALVAGLAKIGSGSSSSAGGSSGSGGGAEVTRSAGDASVVETKDVHLVPKAALSKLSAYAPATSFDALRAACPAPPSNGRQSFSLAVPYDDWDSVQAQLDKAKLLPYSSPLVTVHLRRLAPAAPLTKDALTCP
jgi:hypothetical protein